MDEHLHEERVDGETRERRFHAAPFDELPDGAFVLERDEPLLVRRSKLLRWTPGGYVDERPRPRGSAAVLVTPPSLVAVLASGWDGLVPLLHPSAG